MRACWGAFRDEPEGAHCVNSPSEQPPTPPSSQLGLSRPQGLSLQCPGKVVLQEGDPGRGRWT